MPDNHPFPTPAPDFSAPLALLRACHERILKHAGILEQVAEQVAAEDEVDKEIRDAAQQVHRYFTSAGRHHHEDEEQGLFPLLAHKSSKLEGQIQKLLQEHQRIDALWSELEPFLPSLNEITDTARFKATVGEFIALERAHVQRENSELLAQAEEILSHAELTDIGRSMAERRGIEIEPHG